MAEVGDQTISKAGGKPRTLQFVKRTDIYRSHTRDGEPVQLGNEPGIVPGPENTYSS